MILCVIEISWDGMMFKDNYKTQDMQFMVPIFLLSLARCTKWPS